jgi:hypothetical protein
VDSLVWELVPSSDRAGSVYSHFIVLIMTTNVATEQEGLVIVFTIDAMPVICVRT